MIKDPKKRFWSKVAIKGIDECWNSERFPCKEGYYV